MLIVFNLYRVIGGIGVGLASAVCPMYIGEIAPSNIRGMLVSWNQFAIIFGQLVVYFVNFFILGDHIAPAIQSVGNGMNQILNGGEAAWAIETGWRYMFGCEMVPAGLFALLICFVPETPRYLAMVGQDAKAYGMLAQASMVLRRLRDYPRYQEYGDREDREALLLWFTVYLRGCDALCIPAGCRYQCGALLCASYL